MKFTRVFLEAIGYELAPNVITSKWIEEKLAPLYQKLYLQPGQLEAWTGIRERRWWNPGQSNAEAAARAARKALDESNVTESDIGAIVYTGVCRDQFEPATACGVAAELGLAAGTVICDLSNACIGALNGILDIANRIELGQIKAGLVVACETARDITSLMMERMLSVGTMDFFRTSMATLTGGSGAVGIVLTDGSFTPGRPQLAGGIAMAAPEHHKMCRWGVDGPTRSALHEYMVTDAVGLLKYGSELVKKIGAAFYKEMAWTGDGIDRLISHQVASANRDAILTALGIASDKDFSTFPFLGNMGTVSLPTTAAIAEERGLMTHGMKVAFMGIGSGLNSLMLGWNW